MVMMMRAMMIMVCERWEVRVRESIIRRCVRV